MRTILGLAGMCLVAGCALLTADCAIAPSPNRVAFWFEDAALTFPPIVNARLGGPLSPKEIQSVIRLSREELALAFTGLRVRFVDREQGFWRVAVVMTVPAEGPLPTAGVALPLGPLGGHALVSSEVVSLEAVRYAPSGAARQTILDGIGRGIGRVAAHELAHQILGPDAPHNDTDASSYEYPSPARAAQYYGTLRWTIWRPVLERKIGT